MRSHWVLDSRAYLSGEDMQALMTLAAHTDLAGNVSGPTLADVARLRGIQWTTLQRSLVSLKRKGMITRSGDPTCQGDL